MNPVDKLGVPIERGDTIVWAEAGGRGGTCDVHTAVVNRMTDKQVQVKKTEWSNLWRPFDCVIVLKKWGGA